MAPVNLGHFDLTDRDLVAKVRDFYLHGRDLAASQREAGEPVEAHVTQQEIANELGLSFAYLNGLFKAIERHLPIPRMRGNNLKALDAFVRRRKL